MLKKIFKDLKISYVIIYVLSFVIAAVILVLIVQTTNIRDFIIKTENKTFDSRQSMLVNNKVKKANKDIVIVAIDDASYEYLLDKYGEWPIPREVYAKLINYIELQNPTSITLDLMFVKSLKSAVNADTQLANSMDKYDNILTAINFDNQAFDVRLPIALPDKMSINVTNNSNEVDLSKTLKFSNCRAIIPQILNSNAQIGIINVIRSNDGILRKMPAMAIYQDKFYPHLSLLTGMNYLKKVENQKINEVIIDKNSDLNVGNKKIPMDSDGGIILNWYGHAGKTYTTIPLYKIIQAMDNPNAAQNFTFKNKIIYIGTTATSMNDNKSVPISDIGETYPGVEIYATYMNNFLDGNFIKKINKPINALITVILALFVGIIVIKTNSTVIAIGTTLITAIGYTLVTYFLMQYFNIWLAVVIPFITIILVFVCAYIIKYLIKSRDFEHQYKLATTDGLTELYNHRYFQDQMKMQIEHCKRYGNEFSLIIIDIDFFKKFNDTYGHQAGDAVLKQVAKTLKNNTRSTDIVCRYGGEEMSIILTNTDKEEALLNAQRICKEVASKPYKLNSTQESHVTISLGISTFPKDGETPQLLIECADNGLYYAKEHGRNQVGLPPQNENSAE